MDSFDAVGFPNATLSVGQKNNSYCNIAEVQMSDPTRYNDGSLRGQAFDSQTGHAAGVNQYDSLETANQKVYAAQVHKQTLDSINAVNAPGGALPSITGSYFTGAEVAAGIWRFFRSPVVYWPLGGYLIHAYVHHELHFRSDFADFVYQHGGYNGLAIVDLCNQAFAVFCIFVTVVTLRRYLKFKIGARKQRH